MAKGLSPRKTGWSSPLSQALMPVAWAEKGVDMTQTTPANRMAGRGRVAQAAEKSSTGLPSTEIRHSAHTARMAGTTTPTWDQKPKWPGRTTLPTSGRRMAATVSRKIPAVSLPRRDSGSGVRLAGSKSRKALASGRQTATAAIIARNITAAKGTPTLSHWA